jgi:flagellar basal-body rod protein FlgG
MLDSLYISATGMGAQQLHVDAISNNLANITTPGFKRTRVNFDDLVYRLQPQTARAASEGRTTRLGAGVAIGSTSQYFGAGDLKKTEQPLDLAIRGAGFFEVNLPDGGVAYTRAGSLQLDRDGRLSTAQGHALAPGLQIPPDATAITIDASGVLRVTLPDEAQPVEIGQLELASFINPGGLRPLGDNLYAATEHSGEPQSGKPGERGLGSVAQGFVEGSNVRLADEFVNLVIAQRAYEANAKAIQAADEMLGIINGLRR